jgi:MSHA biogenesis protein MshN
LLIGGALSALLLAGLIFWCFAPETTGNPALGIKMLAEALPDNESVEAPVPATLQNGTGSFLSTTVSLNAIRLREIGSFIHFEADFDRPPVYHFTLANDRRSFHLDLVGVRQAVELPPVVRRRWLAGVQTRQNDTGLAVSLILEPTITIRDFSATMQVAGTGYRLLLDLYPEVPAETLNQQKDQPAATGALAVADKSQATANQVTEDHNARMQVSQEIAPTEPSGTLVYNTDKLSAKTLAEQAYRRGQMALAAGRNQEGTVALMQALDQHPAHLAARQTLVSELLRQQRQSEAGVIMAEGLRLDPTQLPMRLRYAELLMTQDKLDVARDLLLQGPPQSSLEAPQLHALLAAIYQRLGQYQEAGQEYQALLTSQPDNGLWQMGLGIAREHAGGLDEAIVAYRAALAGRGLSPALNNYVRQRLAVLQP